MSGCATLRLRAADPWASGGLRHRLGHMSQVLIRLALRGPSEVARTGRSSLAMVLSGGYRRWRRRRKATNVPTTEELRANPTAYGHVGNGRMAMPVEDWLNLVEAFGPGT